MDGKQEILIVLLVVDDSPEPPRCSICKKPVHHTMAKTDGDGKAIHEECHLLQLGLKQTSPPRDHSDQAADSGSR
jgi:hypothetical protein